MYRYIMMIMKVYQDKIDKIDLEIVSFRSKIKKKLHFNNKMQINVEIKRLDQKKNELVEGLR